MAPATEFLSFRTGGAVFQKALCMSERIVRIDKRDNPYVQIDNTVLEDSRISFKAKGILAYLLSKPPNWTVRIEDLVKHSGGDGPKSIRSGLKELEKFGYAKLTRGGGDAGSFWCVFEKPIQTDTDTPQKAMSSDRPKMATSPKRDIPQKGTLSNTDSLVIRKKSSNTEGSSTPKEPSFHSEFIDGWMKRFKERHGFDYVFGKGRDGAAVKTLSSLGMTAKEVLDLAEKAWSHPKPFIVDISQTICSMASRINEIRLAVQKSNVIEPVWAGYADLNALEAAGK